MRAASQAPSAEPYAIDPARAARREAARKRVQRQRRTAVAGVLAAAAVPALAFAFAGRTHTGQAALDPGRLAPAAAVEEERRFDIVATGDLLIHGPVWERAEALGHGRYDFRPLFARIRPTVRGAALALCHVETPMGAGSPSGYPVFNSPPELAKAIAWTGWDACSTASNHSVDRGQFGVETTAAALDRAGVRHTGTSRSRKEARRTLFLRVHGLRVALLSYTYGTNGIPSPRPWSVNILSARKVIADARRARRRGADFVIANLHWGSEYVHEPNTQQRAIARRLLRRGAIDLIVGQHAHVVQPIRRIHGRYVVFGEGNLLSYQTVACCRIETQDGLMAVIHVRAVGRRARVTGVDYIPTWVEHPSLVVQPVLARLRELRRQGKGDTPLARALQASYRRTVGYVGKNARIRPVAR